MVSFFFLPPSDSMQCDISINKNIIIGSESTASVRWDETRNVTPSIYFKNGNENFFSFERFCGICGKRENVIFVWGKGNRLPNYRRWMMMGITINIYNKYVSHQIDLWTYLYGISYIQLHRLIHRIQIYMWYIFQNALNQHC